MLRILRIDDGEKTPAIRFNYEVMNKANEEIAID